MSCRSSPPTATVTIADRQTLLWAGPGYVPLQTLHSDVDQAPIDINEADGTHFIRLTRDGAQTLALHDGKTGAITGQFALSTAPRRHRPAPWVAVINPHVAPGQVIPRARP